VYGLSDLDVVSVDGNLTRVSEVVAASDSDSSGVDPSGSILVTSLVGTTEDSAVGTCSFGSSSRGSAGESLSGC